jgi:cytidine deaminase
MTSPMSEPSELLAEARGAAADAYAPYSSFRVGAVVVASDGQRFRGANVENAAFGATVCAEANAIATAVAAGSRRLHTVAVACIDGDECYPCGNCRQMMREFGVERVIVQDASGEARLHTLGELLPHAFGPESLT